MAFSVFEIISLRIFGEDVPLALLVTKTSSVTVVSVSMITSVSAGQNVLVICQKIPGREGLFTKDGATI